MPDKEKTRRSTSRASATGRTKTRRWSAEVDTVSTFPPEGTFTKDAQSVARIMASKKVSPKGLGSAIRMVQFFINRAGENLSRQRKRELEKAKEILQRRLQKQRQKSGRRPSSK
jgi:tRNA(adenine34) deaminase